MAIIHGYIDTVTGNIGYVGDLEVSGDTYRDASQKPQVLTGNIADVKYVRVGRHTFEYWERQAPEVRWQRVQEYPRFISSTPTH